MKTTLFATLALAAHAASIRKHQSLAEVRVLDDSTISDPPLPPYVNYSTQEECTSYDPQPPAGGWGSIQIPYKYKFVQEACICEIHSEYS